MQPRINISSEVKIVTLVYSTEKIISASSLSPGDIIEARSFGNCTTKVRIIRNEKPLRFGVKTSSPQGGKVDLAINLATHEELDFFNPQSKITEDFIIRCLIVLFPGLWCRGELLPESTSYIGKYKIFDVIQTEKQADILVS